MRKILTNLSMMIIGSVLALDSMAMDEVVRSSSDMKREVSLREAEAAHGTLFGGRCGDKAKLNHARDVLYKFLKRINTFSQDHIECVVLPIMERKLEGKIPLFPGDRGEDLYFNGCKSSDEVASFRNPLCNIIRTLMSGRFVDSYDIPANDWSIQSCREIITILRGRELNDFSGKFAFFVQRGDDNGNVVRLAECVNDLNELGLIKSLEFGWGGSSHASRAKVFFPKLRLQRNFIEQVFIHSKGWKLPERWFDSISGLTGCKELGFKGVTMYNFEQIARFVHDTGVTKLFFDGCVTLSKTEKSLGLMKESKLSHFSFLSHNDLLAFEFLGCLPVDLKEVNIHLWSKAEAFNACRYILDRCHNVVDVRISYTGNGDSCSTVQPHEDSDQDIALLVRLVLHHSLKRVEVVSLREKICLGEGDRSLELKELVKSKYYTGCVNSFDQFVVDALEAFGTFRDVLNESGEYDKPVSDLLKALRQFESDAIDVGGEVFNADMASLMFADFFRQHMFALLEDHKMIREKYTDFDREVMRVEKVIGLIKDAALTPGADLLETAANIAKVKNNEDPEGFIQELLTPLEKVKAEVTEACGRLFERAGRFGEELPANVEAFFQEIERIRDDIASNKTEEQESMEEDTAADELAQQLDDMERLSGTYRALIEKEATDLIGRIDVRNNAVQENIYELFIQE